MTNPMTKMTSYTPKQIQGYRNNLKGAANYCPNGATVELDVSVARALVEILDQMKEHIDRDQVRISEMATTERASYAHGEERYDDGYADGVLAGQRSILLSLGAGGVAVTPAMVRAAQETYDRNPEYGLTDQDMQKAIRAAFRHLGQRSAGKRRKA